MYEVRVFDGDGKLKQTIDKAEVSKLIWERNGVDPGNYRGKVRSSEYIKKKCKGCGKIFPVKGSGQLFCQNEDGKLADKHACYKEYTRKRLRKPAIKHTCPTCNTDFMGNKMRRFCNNPCRDFKINHDPKTK